MTKTQLVVSGMTCGHCVGRVTNALKEVDGVKSVEVNLAEGTATVESDVDVDVQVLKDAVGAVGFSA